MRNLLRLLAVLGVLALAQAVSAQMKLPVDDPGPISGGISTDSTSFTLPNGMTSAGVQQDSSRTTTAYDLSQRVLADCNFAGQPIIKASVLSNMAAGDTVELRIEYSTNNSNWYSATYQNLIGASPQAVVLQTCDTHANAPSLGFRYVRFTIRDADVTRTAAYTSVSITPLIIGSR